MSKDSRQFRDLHALNEEGMVLCNPRDKEAAHRAQMGGIATDDRASVTCRSALRCCTGKTRLGARGLDLPVSTACSSLFPLGRLRKAGSQTHTTLQPHRSASASGASTRKWGTN